jgi:hypothetical protein
MPRVSPHGLRRRRGSLHYKRAGSLADVAHLLGDSKRAAAEHYVCALTDYREVDRTIALARRAIVTPTRAAKGRWALTFRTRPMDQSGTGPTNSTPYFAHASWICSSVTDSAGAPPSGSAARVIAL